MRTSDRKDEISNYILEHKPEFFWLHSAAQGDFVRALPMTPTNNLLGLAFKTAMDCLENDKDPSSEAQKIRKMYIEDVLIPAEYHRAPLQERVKLILSHRQLTPREAASDALTLALTEQKSEKSAISSSIEPIFEYLLRQDRDKEQSQLIHLQIWSLISKAIAALDCKNYDQCLRQGSMAKKLNESDWMTVERIMDAVGYEDEGPHHPR